MGAYDHFGSASDVFDNDTDIATVYITGQFQIDAHWSLDVNGSFTNSKAKFDPIEVTVPEETVGKADYDFSGINEYSDLEFKQLEVGGTLTKMLSEKASAYIGLNYFDLTDDAPYVYGDVSGSVLYTRAGFQVRL
ncbi:MAG: hypothetical protein KDA27_07760 [Candidatus Eisenbacteria bacterium]|uniref:Uncharacterized protein n=1 Tax=Eiseniibacteriota bacterium TaxID=2212470 RepID=A0A956NAH7_UNCEI|nr:hypothetical protein [Candidatus Eisenbacteria bacterium]MCB9462105.1 hypothetical protein [Candidatus Eisenbacteria bacterium]